MLSANDSTLSVARLTPHSDLSKVVLLHMLRTSTLSNNIDANVFNSFNKNRHAYSKISRTRTGLASRKFKDRD